MAFLSKVGNILRQGANKRIGSDLQASSLSICQAVRWMSSMQSSKLFVGGFLEKLFFFSSRNIKSPISFSLYCACTHAYDAGISFSTDDQSLREAFTKYGEVVEGILPFPNLFTMCG